MKLTISQPKLANALAVASHAVATKAAHPALSHVLLHGSSENQKLTITAFDLKLGIRCECDCTVEGDGTIALPAKLLEDVVLHLPKSDIALELINNVAILTHSTGKCQIQTANPEDFPALPADNNTLVTLSAVKLQQILKATLFAASRDETKQVIAGVNFKLTSTHWEAAATDGHRLAVASGTTQTNSALTAPEPVELTVPYQTLTDLESILNDVTGDCTISIGNAIAVFDLQNIRVTTRLLEGQYPLYPSLIPTQFQYQFTVDKKAFDSALKRTSIVAEQKNKVVKMTLDLAQQSATLTAESPDLGGAVEALAIHTQSAVNENLVVGFNIKYLLDAVKFTYSEKISIEANQPNQPVVIKPVGDAIDQLIMVMPVQLPWTEPVSSQSGEAPQTQSDSQELTPSIESEEPLPEVLSDEVAEDKREISKPRSGKKKQLVAPA